MSKASAILRAILLAAIAMAGALSAPTATAVDSTGPWSQTASLLSAGRAKLLEHDGRVFALTDQSDTMWADPQPDGAISSWTPGPNAAFHGNPWSTALHGDLIYMFTWDGYLGYKLTDQNEIPSGTHHVVTGDPTRTRGSDGTYFSIDFGSEAYMFALGDVFSDNNHTTVYRAPIGPTGGVPADEIGAFTALPDAMPPNHHHRMAVATTDTHVYVVGGGTGSGTGVGDHRDVFVAPIDATNKRIGPWTEYSTVLSVHHPNPAIAVANDRLYAIAGGVHGYATAVVDGAPINPDGSPGTFEQEDFGLTQPRGELGALATNRAMYAAGGSSSFGHTLHNRVDFVALPNHAQTIAERFAPELVLMNGERCSEDWKHREDPYEPEPVDIVAPVSRVMRDRGFFHGWLPDEELEAHPLSSIDVLSEYSAEEDRNVYVDIVGHGPKEEDACQGYSGLYDDYKNSSENVTYVAVRAEGASVTDKVVVVRFWFFYFFNDWSINRHEGDWERIDLEFRSNTDCEFDSMATLVQNSCDPSLVRYSQHFFEEERSWQDRGLTKREGTHPVSFVATGSHANYFQPGVGILLGPGIDWAPRDPLSPNQGHHSVNVGRRVLPSVLTLDCPDEPTWLTYSGRWGEDVNGGQIQKKKWSGPHANLCEF